MILAVLFFCGTFLSAQGMNGAKPGVGLGMIERLGEKVPLDLELRDEAGRAVTLGEIVNKPTILTLNYFRCAGICSPQLGAVADAVSRTAAVPGKDFQVVTVSFDPRDTPEIAARKRFEYLHLLDRPVTPEVWRFLTGEAKATARLAEAVGFRFQPQGEDFIHPTALIFLSPLGEVTRYMYGAEYVPADLEMAAKEAGSGEARATVPKVLRICYRYDPGGRAYVLSFTRVAALVIIVAGLVFLAFLGFKGRKA